MIKKLCILWLFFGCLSLLGQVSEKEQQRIKEIQVQLDTLSTKVPGLNKPVNFNVNGTKLTTFIRAVATTNQINIGIASELNNIQLSQNFFNIKVKDVITYLCKEYQLTIELIENIISLKKYVPPVVHKPFVPRDILVTYDKENNDFSIDLQNDSLSVAFKKITDVTGRNLVFSPKLSGTKLSGYIKNKSFDSAIDKLAFTNNLVVTKTKDGYYLFEKAIKSSGGTQPRRYKGTNFHYTVKDTLTKTLEVDFAKVEIASIIKDIGYDLNINMFTNSPLEKIGTATVKANDITYDALLTMILEDTKFTFRKSNNIYFFGEKEKPYLIRTEVVPLIHRSIEMMNEPLQSQRQNFNTGFVGNGNLYGNGINQNFNTNGNYANGQVIGNQRGSFGVGRQPLNLQSRNAFEGSYDSKSEALLSLFPKELQSSKEGGSAKGFQVTADKEQNSFIVTGNAEQIKKFKEFVKKIDKPVPVILIEVMILEVSKTATVNTGVELGIGDKPTTDKGTLFPSANLNLGATTINKIIGGFNNFGSLNVGRVVPNFYARIRALETNGNIKIRSTPRLSTLNGHQALLSNGERSYYAVTRRDIIGSQNPQTTEIKNYVPIDADLSIAIKPFVAGDEQITLSINVSQSNFNGKRIDPEAPPGMNSREFTSTIRVKDQDVIILGGLEENMKNDSGSGVPFLARIPVIKWLFSKKTRTDSKTKLSVLIKPIIIR